MRRVVSGLLLPVVLWLCVGCGGDPLADDEHGAEACRVLGEVLAPDADAVVKVGGLLVAGGEAWQSTTPAIKDTVTPMVGDSYLADRDELHAACVDAGVEMPDLSP